MQYSWKTTSSMAISPSIGSATRASIIILNELRSGSDFICINHLCHKFPRSPLILSNSIMAESGCLKYVKLKYDIDYIKSIAKYINGMVNPSSTPRYLHHIHRKFSNSLAMHIIPNAYFAGVVLSSRYLKCRTDQMGNLVFVLATAFYKCVMSVRRKICMIKWRSSG